MIFINIFSSLIAPLIIPLLDHLLSKVRTDASVVLTDTGLEYKKDITVFVKEMPSAFIANAIWGLTYTCNISGEATQIWAVIYFSICIVGIVLLVYSFSKVNVDFFNMTIKRLSIIIIIITLIRMANYNFTLSYFTSMINQK